MSWAGDVEPDFGSELCAAAYQGAENVPRANTEFDTMSASDIPVQDLLKPARAGKLVKLLKVRRGGSRYWLKRAHQLQ